jgi:hypothetical protein
MDRWKSYLFESHSEDILRNWANRLSFFRFFRAYGGHANDGDSLDAAFRYQNFEQLQRFLEAMGVSLVKYDEKPPQPEPGVSYSADEFAKFLSLIPNSRWIQQPEHCTIEGQNVFIWCANEIMKISISDGYWVTESNVVAAEVVEKAIENCDLERIDPPVNTKHYICPQHYPKYFG